MFESDFSATAESEPAKPREPSRWLFELITGPMWKLDEVRMLRHMDACVVAARAESYPAYVKAYHQAFPEAEGFLRDYESMGLVRRFTRFLSSILMPVLDRATVLHFRVIGSRRMAATALAMRLYEIDNGRRPEKLDDLVGRYVAAVPDDPFAGAGKLRYLKDAKQPLLYSVNADGRDDGGKFETPESSWPEPPDWVFFLNGDRPRGKCDWKEPGANDTPSASTRPATSTSRSSGATSRPPRAPSLSE